MSIGVIVRDSNGEVLTTLSAPKKIIIDLIMVEAMAVLQVVYFS